LVHNILYLALRPSELISNHPDCQKPPNRKPKPELQTILTYLMEWSQPETYIENKELYKMVERAHKLFSCHN